MEIIPSIFRNVGETFPGIPGIVSLLLLESFSSEESIRGSLGHVLSFLEVAEGEET